MKATDYSILIVDDEPANTRLLERILRDEYKLRVAHGGAKALEIANEDCPPALILLDVMMPDIDGFEVCRRLKADEHTKDIMVMFITAIGDHAAEEVGLNLGAIDYITKPVSVPIVRARVRNHMSARRKADMLEALSYIDSLTHTHNRRRLDSTLINEWRRARRAGHPLALVMIDFDHFKALNDHYGHGNGDLCLQQGTKAIASVLKRPGDLLARYGGEEFVALLPETDLQGAAALAEAMRLAVKALNLPHEYSSAAAHVTISLGVAALIPGEDQDSAELLELADQALNQAKSEGRDRVCLASSPLAQSVPAPASNSAEEPVPHTTALPLNLPGAAPHPGPSAETQWHAPLSLMLKSLEHLLDSELDEHQRQHLQIIKASANSLRAELDASSEAMDTEPATEPAREPQTSAPCGAATPRILLVDDDRANQVVIRAMLRKLDDLQVELAGNGRAALDALARQPFDLVLMDCHMPELDGLEVTRALRNSPASTQNAQIPVIAMGALDSGVERDECLEAGMDDYLPKPLDLGQLALILAKYHLLSAKSPLP